MICVNRHRAGAVVSNAVIAGPSIALSVSAGREDEATITTDYSNYDPATNIDEPGVEVGPVGLDKGGGPRRCRQVGVVDDPGAGDYHLLSISPLIDIGDPVDPPLGELDIDGDPRLLDGDGVCPTARDIGADEFVGSAPLDCEAPETSITGGPQGPIENSRPTFSFISEPGADFECRFDAQPFAPCSGAGAHTPAAALPDGPHSFAVRAIDAALNIDPTPATRTFAVDTIAPESTVKGRKRFATRRKRARVPFLLGASETGSTFQCKLDGRPFRACAPPYRTPRLKPGKHVLRVRATDPIGNPDGTPAVKRFRIVRKRRR